MHMATNRTITPAALAFAAGFLAFIFCGCVSKAQLSKLQQEKAQLTQLVAAEKERTAQLQEQLVAVNQRAADAERELALAFDGGKSEGKPAGKLARTASFEPWARSHSELRFDPVRRVARLPLSISLRSDDRLSFTARRELDKAADLLLAPDARSWGARVICQESEIGEMRTLQRANAMVDYLKQRGIAPDRLQVSTRKTKPLVDEEGRPTSSNQARVEVEFFELGNALPANANVATGTSDEEGWVSAKQRRR